MIGGGVQDIKARIALDGAPQFAGQAKAAADSLGQISAQLGRVAASAEDIGRIGGSMAEIQADARASALALQQLAGRLNEVHAASDRAGRAASFMDRFGPGAVGIGGLLAVKAAVTGVADEMLKVSARAETLQSSLRFAIGADVGREMAYLRRVTSELGLEFTSSARAYAGFAAAAKETRLEGAGARQVFESVAGAAAVMGLSADNAQGVLLALQQMMSKGVVSAEELRGQLGERLPGVFQIAARAVGVTTGELGKMLQAGELLAEDFLPKFAAQLKQELGDGVGAAANRTEASINRLANAWERFKGVDGGATSGFIAGQLNIASDALNDFSSSVEKARAEGDGFFGQFVAGVGAIARFANPFNALSYGAQEVGAKLRAAEDELAGLERRLKEEPGNVFTRMLIRDTEQLIERLRQAKTAQDQLGDIGAGGGRGFVNPQTVGADLAERADLEGKLNTIRDRGVGVNKEWVASLQALDAMQRKGLITDAERIKMAQDLTAETYKAGRATASAFASLSADIAKTTELNNARAQAGGNLTKGQELEIQLNARLADSLGKLTAAQAARIRQQIAGAVASADAAEAAERERRAAEQLSRARATEQAAEDRAIDEHLARLEKERQAVLRSVDDRSRALEVEAAAAQYTAGRNITLAEGIEMVAVARLREKQARYEGGTLAWQEIQQEIDARQRLLGLMADKRAQEAGVKAAADAAAQWRETSNDIRTALTDAFRRAFESGESFGRAFGQVIEREIKARLASAVAGLAADGVIQLVGGAVGLAASAAGDGRSGGAGNWMQAASLGKDAYNLYSGGGMYAAAGNYAAVYSGSAYGTAFGSQQSAMLAAQEAGMVSQAGAGTMSSWASAAGWAALIALGVAKAMDDYSDGFRSEGARQLQDDLGGGAQGWILGGLTADFSNLAKKIGFNDKWADLLSGATGVAKLFGRALPRVDAQGVSGSIADGDFSGQMFADVVQKGGIFRSDKRWTELAALPDDLGRFLDAGAADVLARARQFGDALGLPGQQLGQVTSDLRIEFSKPENDTKEAIAEATRKNLAAIAKELGEYGDDLVQSWAAAVAPVAQYGESAAQTIARVGQALLDVNSVLESIGVAALATSVDGGAAAVALADLFGGVQGLQQAAGGYAQNFLTEAERLDIVRGQLTQAFAEYGTSLPTTREAFRALVEAQDRTTESGREAFAALLGVADAFASITPAARAAADILAERQQLERELLQLQGNTAAIRALERAELDASNRALYDQIKALEDQADAAELAERASEEAAKAAETAAKATKDMADAWARLTANALQGVQSAYGAVLQAVDDERQSVQASAEKAARLAQDRADEGIRALEQQARTIETTFGGLARAMADQAQRLEGLLGGDGGRAAALQALRNGAAGIAAGLTPDTDALRQAAGTAAQIDTREFATALDYRRAVAETGALLRRVGSAASGRQTAELAAIAAQQVAIEQASAEEIAALEAARDAQLYVLDQQLAEARAQASTLVRISDGVQGVAGAIGALASAITAARALQGQQAPAADTGRWLDAGNTEVWNAAGGAVAARQAGATMDGTLIKGLRTQFTAAEAQAFVNDRLQADDITGIYARAVAEGIDSAALDALMGWAPGTSLAEARRRGLPAFATGTAYVPSTGVAIVHEGERIIPAADNADLMRILRGDGGSGALVAEVRRLREEVAALRKDSMAGHHATASATGKAARLLDDVVNGGASIATRAES